MALHGRERYTRMAFMLILMLASTQPPAGAPNLPIELAAKIAAAVAPATNVALDVVAAEVPANMVDDADERVALRDELERTLRMRGIRVSDRADGVVVVSVSCSNNLRERACIAEIVKPGGDRAVAGVTRPHDGSVRADPPAPLSLEVRPLFGQRAPILDIALVADRLFVLDPAALTLYQRSAAGWLRLQSRTVASSRPWPRDLRGRLRIEGNTVDALLPGVTCRANIDLANLSCADDRQAWPLGIDNNGVDASRNFFTTPEGLPFYAAASLAGDASNSRWLIADRFGVLTFLDHLRRPVATAGPGDDVVALTAACGGGYLLVSSPRGREDRGDALRLFRMVERRLVPAAAPLELPGTTTALWASPGATLATAVTHDLGADRYEAFHIGIACDR